MGTKLAYFCSSNSWGGLEMNHLRNARWMFERGHNVVVLGLALSPIHVHAQAMELPFVAIEPHRRWYDFKAVKRTLKIISSEKITHFIIRKPGDMSLAAGLKYKLKDQLVVSYFMEMQLGIKKKSIFHTIRYRYIDVWACPLNWLKAQVETHTHFRNKLVVIPSGIELDGFENLPLKATSKDAFELPKNTFIFGMAGRFDPKKGQLVLLEAMLKTKHSDFSVVLMGETTFNEGSEYVQTIHEFVKKHRLENRVIFRQHDSTILHFYRGIDWMVMASESETVGMVTIESLACETPVLGSNAGGTPEILNEPLGGILFETLNASDLAAKMDQVMVARVSPSPQQLKQLVSHNDHQRVCAKVEEALGLTSAH